ncbi:hypothetical protein [Kribbella sp. CA-293567]|uniref:hypothetical protein n=1 Tax=Kribbella sp. CA-293567 TaxID=3002436 RepID=UPI0022DD0541|nr:hypothetical protein [Kribbella sp. CA-293567]WBQ05770.1 hypothetical protein OX958_02950 [Kribbella sp. CA-293567]
MRFRFRVVALATTLPLLVGLAGCADDAAVKPVTGTAKPAVAAQAKAAKPPARLTTATFVPVTLAAYAKVKSWAGVMRISLNGQVVIATVTQTYQPAAMRIDLSGPQFGGVAHAILINEVLYLHLPIPEARGKYLKYDPKATKDPTAVAMARLFDGVDPAKSNKAMRKAVVRVKFVASDTIGYRKVDRYDVTMNNAAMLRALGMKRPAGLPKTSVQSIWVGADRLTYKMLSGETQVTVTGYDSVAPITAPSARMITKTRS